MPVVDTTLLLELGVPEVTANVWTAMLSHPGADPEALAELLQMSETQVREHLDVLADLALVRASRQRPELLVPVAAEAGMVLLLRRHEEESAARRVRIEQYRERISRALNEGLAAGGESGQIEHLIGPDVIQARFERLAYTVAETIDTLTPGARIAVEVLDGARPLDAHVLSRGVRMRMLYQESICNDAATIGYARELEGLGATVRTAPLLPQRLYVADRRIALVPLDPAEPARGAVCVSAPGAIAALLELFEMVWVHAAPLDVGKPIDSATGLTDAERHLLGMLAAGMTDDAVAKRLGVSLRTVSRRMEDIMRRLDAGSRFDAGVKAAKKGWL